VNIRELLAQLHARRIEVSVIEREDHEQFFTKLLGDVEECTAPFGLTNVQGSGDGVAKRGESSTSLWRPPARRARALNVSTASLCHWHGRKWLRGSPERRRTSRALRPSFDASRSRLCSLA
jgi:hypothetical protein